MVYFYKLNKFINFVALLYALVPAAYGQEDLRAKKELLPAPIRHFLFFEQERIDRSVDTVRLMAPTAHADARYNPDSGNVFEVDSYWVDSDKMFSAKGIGLEPRLENLFFRVHEGRNQVRLMVHPESKKFYASVTNGLEVADKFYATATSSSRSCVVWKEGVAPFMVKMSLDLELGGVNRTIPASEVSRSIGTNNVIETDRASLPSDFETFPEVVSVIPQGMKRGGMIVRQFPLDLIEGRANYIPIFALYALPPGQGPPLLAEMIRKSGRPALEFIRDHFIRPFARQWLDLTIFNGISMEPHGQNMLAKVDNNDMPIRGFGHRDMGGFDIAFPYRKALGMKAAAEPLPVIKDFAGEYHQADSGGEPEYVGALGRSIYTHFESGLVFNVDRQIATWAKNGWIPQEAGLADQPLAKMLKAELEEAYLWRTGTQAQLGNTSELKGLVVKARKTLETRAKFLAPAIARGDYSLARELLASASTFGPKTLSFVEKLRASGTLADYAAQGLQLPRPSTFEALDPLVATYSASENAALFSILALTDAERQAAAVRASVAGHFETEAHFNSFFEAHFGGMKGISKEGILKSNDLDVLPWAEARLKGAATIEAFRAASDSALADFGKRPELLKLIAQKAATLAPHPAVATVAVVVEFLSLKPSITASEMGTMISRSLARARTAGEVLTLAKAAVPNGYNKDRAQLALWDARLLEMRKRLNELNPTSAEKAQLRKLASGGYFFFCVRNLQPLLTGATAH
jgi:hypothetical protein